MAIDPSLSLQINPPQNPLAMVGQYASAASALQSIQNMKAALPGIQADSAIKQRAAAFNSWMTANASKYVKTTPTEGQVDAMGNPVTGPTDAKGNPVPTLDHAAFISAAANQGYLPEAQSIMASDLKNKSTELSNGLTQANIANTQAATNLTNTNNATNATNLAITSRGYVSTLMDAYQKANPTGGTDGSWDRENNRLINGIQNLYGKALNVQGVFGSPDTVKTDPQGNVVKDPNSGKPVMNYKYDPVENNAMMTATMTPQVQQELKNSREIIEQSGATGMSSAAYRDPNSSETAAARKIAIASDPSMADTYGSMTGAQLAANPRVGPAILATINPQGARTTAVSNMIQNINDAKNYGSAADALDKLKAKFPGDADINSSPIAWIHNNAARFANDKEFTTAQTMLDNINLTHADLKLSSMDAGSLSHALRAQQTNSLNLGGSWGSVATAPTTSAAAQGVAESSGRPNATPTKPQGGGQPTGTVRVKGPDGRTGTIPASQLTAAKTKGYTQVQ